MVLYECKVCQSKKIIKAIELHEPYPNEVKFSFIDLENFDRKFIKCQDCGHFFEDFNLSSHDFYEGQYISDTYGDLRAIDAKYRQILALPPEQSDNFARCANLNAFYDNYLASRQRNSLNRSLLDIGAGLGVFGTLMAEYGWDCELIDLDESLVQHHRLNCRLKSFCGEISEIDLGNKTYSLISLIKVIEHIDDPLSLISAASQFLAIDGILYVEVPDGEAAFAFGGEREEFYMGHVQVYSTKSLEIILLKAGYRVLSMEPLLEPSGKFTIRAMAVSF